MYEVVLMQYFQLLFDTFYAVIMIQVCTNHADMLLLVYSHAFIYFL